MRSKAAWKGGRVYENIIVERLSKTAQYEKISLEGHIIALLQSRSARWVSLSLLLKTPLAYLMTTNTYHYYHENIPLVESIFTNPVVFPESGDKRLGFLVQMHRCS